MGNGVRIELELRWGFPLVAIVGSHRGWIRDRAPPPVSGSWREEANDAGVFRGVWGPAFPGGLDGSLRWEKDPRCPPHWPKTVPPGRTPPSPLDTAVSGPGDGSPESPGPDRPPRHLWWVSSLLLDLLSSRTTSGLKQRDMKSGWDTIMSR